MRAACCPFLGGDTTKTASSAEKNVTTGVQWGFGLRFGMDRSQLAYKVDRTSGTVEHPVLRVGGRRDPASENLFISTSNVRSQSLVSASTWNGTERLARLLGACCLLPRAAPAARPKE